MCNNYEYCDHASWKWDGNKMLIACTRVLMAIDITFYLAHLCHSGILMYNRHCNCYMQLVHMVTIFSVPFTTFWSQNTFTPKSLINQPHVKYIILHGVSHCVVLHVYSSVYTCRSLQAYWYLWTPFLCGSHGSNISALWSMVWRWVQIMYVVVVMSDQPVMSPFLIRHFASMKWVDFIFKDPGVLIIMYITSVYIMELNAQYAVLMLATLLKCVHICICKLHSFS